MANRYTGPMQVGEDSPRPWLQGGYSAPSYAINQDKTKGVIYDPPTLDPPLFCMLHKYGWYCAPTEYEAATYQGGQVYDQLPDRAIGVRADFAASQPIGDSDEEA